MVIPSTFTLTVSVARHRIIARPATQFGQTATAVAGDHGTNALRKETGTAVGRRCCYEDGIDVRHRARSVGWHIPLLNRGTAFTLDEHQARRIELRGPCPDRRIGEHETTVTEINASKRQRNGTGTRIRWMFTTDRARDELARAYPKTHSES